MTNLDYGSWMSGGGIADIGVGTREWTMKFAVDNDMHAKKLYDQNFKRPLTLADVARLDRRTMIQDLGYTMWFHASPVCTRMSRANRNGEESRLDIAVAEKIAEFIRLHRQPVVTIENVVEYKKSISLSIIIEALIQCGYQWEMKTIDFSMYGIPQRRKRMFLIASTFLPVDELWPVPANTETGWWCYLKLFDWQPKRNVKSMATRMRRLLHQLPSGLSWPILISEKSTNPPKKGQTGRQLFWRRHDEASMTLAASDWKSRAIMYSGDADRVAVLTTRDYARLFTVPDSYRLTGHTKNDIIAIGNGIPSSWMQQVARQIEIAYIKDDAKMAVRLVDLDMHSLLPTW